MKRFSVLLLIAVVGLAVLDAQTPTTDWPAVGGDIGGMKYSPLDQITPANVSKLTQAWEYTGGGVPIVVENVMYFASGGNIVAVKADTGTEVWKYLLSQATRCGTVQCTTERWSHLDMRAGSGVRMPTCAARRASLSVSDQTSWRG